MYCWPCISMWPTIAARQRSTCATTESSLRATASEVPRPALPSSTLVVGNDHDGLVGQDTDDAGDDQVGTLRFRVAVCPHRDAAGGGRPACHSHDRLDPGGDG